MNSPGLPEEPPRPAPADKPRRTNPDLDVDETPDVPGPANKDDVDPPPKNTAKKAKKPRQR